MLKQRLLYKKITEDYKCFLFAEGQATWKKIDTNVHGLTRRLQKTLGSYNIFSELPVRGNSELLQRLSFDQVNGNDNVLYMPDTSCHRLLTLQDTVSRAQEELSLLSSECVAAHSYYTDRHESASLLLEKSDSHEGWTHEYRIGYKALLTKQMWQYEVCLQDLENISSSVCIQESLILAHPKPVLQDLGKGAAVACNSDYVLSEIGEEEKAELLSLLENDSETESESEEDMDTS